MTDTLLSKEEMRKMFPENISEESGDEKGNIIMFPIK